MSFKKIDIRFIYFVVGVFLLVQSTALFAAAGDGSCPKEEAIKRFLTYPNGIVNALETVDILIVSHYEQNPTPEVKEHWYQKIMRAHRSIRLQCSELIRIPSSPEECDKVTADISIFVRHIDFQKNLMHLIEEIRQLHVLQKNYNMIRSSSRCDIQIDDTQITYYKKNRDVMKKLSALSHVRNDFTTRIMEMCRLLNSELSLVADVITVELKLLVPQIFAWAQAIANTIMRIEADLKNDLGNNRPLQFLAGAILHQLPADDGVNPFE